MQFGTGIMQNGCQEAELRPFPGWFTAPVFRMPNSIFEEPAFANNWVTVTLQFMHLKHAGGAAASSAPGRINGAPVGPRPPPEPHADPNVFQVYCLEPFLSPRGGGLGGSMGFN